MTNTIVIRGHFDGIAFIPAGELPKTIGDAELIIYSRQEGAIKAPVSIYDLFGKAPLLRSAEEIAAQIQSERDAWSPISGGGPK